MLRLYHFYVSLWYLFNSIPLSLYLERMHENYDVGEITFTSCSRTIERFPRFFFLSLSLLKSCHQSGEKICWQGWKRLLHRVSVASKMCEKEIWREFKNPRLKLFREILKRTFSPTGLSNDYCIAPDQNSLLGSYCCSRNAPVSTVRNLFFKQ